MTMLTFFAAAFGVPFDEIVVESSLRVLNKGNARQAKTQPLSLTGKVQS